MFTHSAYDIEGVSFVSVSHDLPRPWVGIVGGVHGNEMCGQQVIHALSDPSHPLRRSIHRGTVVLIEGNPRACRRHKRFTDGGTDLNRLFEYSFERQIPIEQFTYEHERALSLRPVLEQLDMILDLHSATHPTVPFVITDRAYAHQALQLGCSFVTFGWTDPIIFGPKVILCPVAARGKPSFAAECGQHQDPNASIVALKIAQAFLELARVVEVSGLHSPTPCRFIRVLSRIAKPTQSFHFSRHWNGFDEIMAGTVIGEGGGVTLRTSGDGVVLLPNDQVNRGEDLFYLGQFDEMVPNLPSGSSGVEHRPPS